MSKRWFYYNEPESKRQSIEWKQTESLIKVHDATVSKEGHGVMKGPIIIDFLFKKSAIISSAFYYFYHQ